MFLNTRYFLLVPVLCLLISACRKEASPPYMPPRVYPTYEKRSLTAFGPFRLFTKDGEITDQSLVAQYHDEFEQFFYTPSGAFTIPELTRFAVVRDDSIWNLSTAPVGELKRQGTGEYSKYIGKNLIPINDTNDLNLHLGLHKIYFPANVGNYHYFEMESPAVIMKRSGDSLLFPMIRYIRIRRAPGIVSFGSDRINNQLRVEGAAKLGVSDTLLLQTFELAIRK